MKRDLDLCLKILQVAANESADKIRFRKPEINGFDSETIGYHIWLLGDAGYLDITHNETTDGSFEYVQINEIKWKGHEFLDAANNENIWKKFKAAVKEKGGSIPFSIANDLLLSIAKREFGLNLIHYDSREKN